MTTEPDDQGAALMLKWMSGAPQCVTNLADNDPQAELAMLKAMGVSTMKVRNAVGRKLSLIGYVVHPATMYDEQSGEQFTKLRCILLCEDGDTISSTSDGVLRVVRVLAQHRGRGRWNPPVQAEVKEFPSDGGKSYCILDVMPTVPAGKRGAK